VAKDWGSRKKFTWCVCNEQKKPSGLEIRYTEKRQKANSCEWNIMKPRISISDIKKDCKRNKWSHGT
jgi:hypothetical protein